MGYMGFGMQKWIYSMRPRKPFSMQRKDSFTVIPTYKRNFKLQPSNKSSNPYFGIALIALMCLIFITHIPKWYEYENFTYQQKMAYKSTQDDYAFNFLMNSGKNRLYSGKISGAYGEFKLAQAIKPNDKEVNYLLLESLEILCLDYNRKCQNYHKLKNTLKL